MSYYENRIKALEEKVAEMARMQRHKAIPVEAKLVERIAEYQAENARLKSEVEHWQEQWHFVIEDNNKQMDEIAALKAEVERLRKAGDAVALDYAERIEIEAGDTAKNLMKKLPVLREWKAAKEGNQP